MIEGGDLKSNFFGVGGLGENEKWPDRPLRITQRTDKRLKVTF